MATKSYKIALSGGSIITIDDVARVQSDGSGRRFYGPVDEEGNEPVLASFDDGMARGHWPASAEIIEPEFAPPLSTGGEE